MYFQTRAFLNHLRFKTILGDRKVPLTEEQPILYLFKVKQMREKNFKVCILS